MTTITDITTLRRGSKRRVVCVDGDPWREMPADVVMAARLAIGDEATPGSLESRIEAVEGRCARERAVRLLTYRERSVHELRVRLTDDGYDAAVVDDTVEAMTRMGLVDDRRFASSTARTLAAIRGAGRDRVRRALLGKGIDAELAQETLEEVLPEEAEEEAAARLAASLARRTGSTVDKLAARLARRGYRPGVALRAARAALGDREAGSHDPGDGTPRPY